MFRLKTVTKVLLFIIVVMIIIFVVGEVYYEFFYNPEIIEGDSSIEDNPEGEVTEMNLKYLGKYKAADEEFIGYSRDFFEELRTFWWQALSLDYYQFLEERFALEHIDYDFDFKNHSYILVYGRPINKLYSDTSTMYGDPVYGKVSDAIVEWDMNTPYESEVMYVYETDKIPLVEDEWN